MPIFLLFVILFAMWIRYEIKKNSQIESDNKTSFIERERQANFARRADIANLGYVSVPLASLPFSDSYDEVKSSYKLSSDIDAEIKSEKFSLMTRYGIIKERFSALITDAIRGNLLEYMGYNVNLLEFVDLSHTPKNILIRAVKNPNKAENVKLRAMDEVKRMMDEFGLSQALYRMIEG